MTEQPIHDPRLETFVNDLWHARYGDPRFGHEDFGPFPALIARADELGDDYWRFVVRLEAAYAGLWSGTGSDVLTLLAWMLRAHDRQAASLDLEPTQMEQFSTTLVDFLESVADLPELSLDQAQHLLDDWVRRVRGSRYESEALVTVVRAKIALHRGDVDEARRLLDGCRDFAPPSGTCEEGARAMFAALYSRCGDHARALELSEPDLVDDGDRCGFFPAETYVALIGAYADAGRREDVVRGAEFIDRIYGEFPGATSHAAAIRALLRVGELRRARELAVERLPHLDRCFTPLDRARLAAALSAVFASVAAVDSDAVVAQRVDRNRPAQARPAADLAVELADVARDIARQFDVRNASDAVSGEIEETLGLRAAGTPDEGVKPVSERSAEELMTGMSVFSIVSSRRAQACAEALAERIGDLSGRTLARARIMLASDLRRTDRPAAVTALREAAAAARPDFPALAAQAELMADAEAAAQGLLDPQLLLQAPDPDPSWSALSQAHYWRFVAVASEPLDAERAGQAVVAGLDTLRRGLSGEIPLVEDQVADRPGAVEADAQSIAAALHIMAASMRASAGFSPDADIDDALVAARRMVEVASTSDQRLEAHAQLAGVLGFAAQLQSMTDEHAALRLMDAAVDNSRYAQRAPLLAQRAELRITASDDLDGAVTDQEQAIAVWMVEGLDHQADAALLDLARIQLTRGDDARSIIETVRPVIDRMSERDDDESVAAGLVVLGRAQVAARMPDDAVVSFSRVLDGAADDEYPGYLAQLHQARAGELMDLGRHPEAMADFDSAAELFAEIGAQYDLGEVYRSAALAAHFGGDDGTAQGFLDRADRVYDELSVEGPVDFERTRLELARADILRTSAPEEAVTLLRSVVERSRAADWLPLAVNGLNLQALIALETGDDAGRARAWELIGEGLRLDPEHPGLNQLAFELND
ncbi:hypothetical protein [Gordonia neofelifaecis]|uniref:Tetratricopeptide tpr_4 n=1 Tax=Gordonia neofelifaecis NRRL B-59395 TaxID=644548 RepID=F1YKI2_9ACTN|nr:hypothetical protein [Gordonia neofelifaecis]EGD54868.1 tetratricopeptide tpr_4 [Gordonia neofelifaecis NRRL B-59395]